MMRRLRVGFSALYAELSTLASIARNVCLVGYICLLYLAGCSSFIDRLAQPGAPDPRPALGRGDRIEIERSELGDYRCAVGIMVCESWGTTWTCECPR
jgi:hypothetical protein